MTYATTSYTVFHTKPPAILYHIHNLQINVIMAMWMNGCLVYIDVESFYTTTNCQTRLKYHCLLLVKKTEEPDVPLVMAKNL